MQALFMKQTKQEKVYLLKMAIMRSFQGFFWLAEVTWLNAA